MSESLVIPIFSQIGIISVSVSSTDFVLVKRSPLLVVSFLALFRFKGVDTDNFKINLLCDYDSNLINFSHLVLFFEHDDIFKSEASFNSIYICIGFAS